MPRRTAVAGSILLLLAATLAACSACGPNTTRPTTPSTPPRLVTASNLADNPERHVGSPVRVRVSQVRHVGTDAVVVRWSGGVRPPVLLVMLPGHHRPAVGAWGYLTGTCCGVQDAAVPSLDYAPPFVLVTDCRWEPGEP